MRSEDGMTDQISDGYHTFGELYDHRRALTSALVNMVGPGVAWRSQQHHEGGEPMFDGYFILGIDLPTGTITYHYKIENWDDFSHARIMERAPEWDGASPAATVERLLSFGRAT